MSVRFAPLAQADQPAVIDHLLGLTADDRVLRFNATLPDEKVVGYCKRWNYATDIVEGAWDGNRLVGLIHLPVFPVGESLVGELGVSVNADWRQRRVATELAARTFDAARRRGVERIYINFLTRNRPMACLARRFTDDIVPDGDETVAKIRLGAPPKAAATSPGERADATPADSAA